MVYGVNGTARGQGYSSVDSIQRTAKLGQTINNIVSRMSEEHRQRVFADLVACEDRGREQAEAAFPQTDANHPDFDMDRFSELFEKQMDMETQVTEACKVLVRQRDNLTNDETTRIGTEGVVKNWPPLPTMRMSVRQIIKAGFALCG